MIQIDNTLVSLDVLERQFLCDLSHCKGICCVEGDSGAPLLEEEVGELEKPFRLSGTIWHQKLRRSSRNKALPILMKRET